MRDRCGAVAVSTVAQRLAPYKPWLDKHTAEAVEPPAPGGRAPASRYDSLLFAFQRFLETGGRTVVELGTIRSFLHGGLPGCNENDPSLWRPEEPQTWDWGAGCFSLLAALSLKDVRPTIHTVDCVPSHIDRCKVVTAPYAQLFRYHVCDSVEFLASLPPHSIDLLYLDTGDMWPIEPTAGHQLREVKVLIRRRLLQEDGVVLIDDVRNATPRRFGDESALGKAKYSIPYLRKHGFRIVFDGYQVALARSKGAK